MNNMERLSELEKVVRRYHQLKVIPMSLFIVSGFMFLFGEIIKLTPLPKYVIDSITSENYFSLTAMSLVLWLAYTALYRTRMRRFKLDEVLKYVDEIENNSQTLDDELIDEIKKHLI